MRGPRTIGSSGRAIRNRARREIKWTGKLQAARLVETILSSVSGVSSAREGAPCCSSSAGIDECDSNDSLTDVIARADAALYRAKRAGKGRVELASADALTVA
ncbi:diguanylate cyclase [Paraburkholderia sp. 5N]|uniref:Diguanylate cyclase n=1 Tax=Paraburkholderia elongata TaxID=2675747 RepID=A0A972SPJ6_9BURK|nr:diguanylate cyclase [Paraburkholderia elongata]